MAGSEKDKGKDKPRPKKPKRSFVGFSEQIERNRDRRENRTKPQPWVVRKLAIAIVFGLAGYTFYVYIGRICVPMIRRSSGALGGRTTGSESLTLVARS